MEDDSLADLKVSQVESALDGLHAPGFRFSLSEFMRSFFLHTTLDTKQCLLSGFRAGGLEADLEESELCPIRVSGTS